MRESSKTELAIGGLVASFGLVFLGFGVNTLATNPLVGPSSIAGAAIAFGLLLLLAAIISQDYYSE